MLYEAQKRGSIVKPTNEMVQIAPSCAWRCTVWCLHVDSLKELLVLAIGGIHNMHRQKGERGSKGRYVFLFISPGTEGKSSEILVIYRIVFPMFTENPGFEN